MGIKTERGYNNIMRGFIKVEELFEFKKCTIISEPDEEDNYEINCKLGLWSVCGNGEDAFREALHYFRQYKEDGEYSDFIGGPSATEVLINKKE